MSKIAVIRYGFILPTVTLLGLVGNVSNAHASTAKPIICNGAYALCNAAACQPIPGIKNKALCNCSIWYGKNIGYSSCKSRKEKVNGVGDKALISTFSFGGGHYNFQNCPGGMAWTSCLDQPCLVDNHSPSGRVAFCTCKIIKNTQPYITFAGNCKKKFCVQFLWSGASIDGNKKLTTILAKALGDKNILTKSACPIKGVVK